VVGPNSCVRGGKGRAVGAALLLRTAFSSLVLVQRVAAAAALELEMKTDTKTETEIATATKIFEG
jgi:hypothetical protein